MHNTIEPKSNQAVDVEPHDEDCKARLELSGFETLTCSAAESDDRIGRMHGGQHLYTWHILRCTQFGCQYQSLVRDDYLIRLMMDSIHKSEEA